MGTLPTSRVIGVAGTHSDVVAFLDDDSIVRPTWLENLVKPYADPRVGAVGGRVVNDLDEVAAADPDSGRAAAPDGRLTGNFAADPGRVVEGRPPPGGQHVLPARPPRPRSGASTSSIPAPVPARTATWGCG